MIESTDLTKRAELPSPKRIGAKFLARFGPLPFLIVPSILIFAWGNPRFVGEANIVNMLQQGVYLLLAAVAQLLVLIAGGFDLSVGSNIALTSIVSSSLMVAVQQAYPGRRVAGRSCWIRGDARGGRLRRNLQCGRRRP